MIRKMRKAEVVREMRDFQRQAAALIIADAVNGNPPTSVEKACLPYRDQIGEGFHFDTGHDWSGDIREAAIYTLVANGFRKGRAVKVG